MFLLLSCCQNYIILTYSILLDFVQGTKGLMSQVLLTTDFQCKTRHPQQLQIFPRGIHTLTLRESSPEKSFLYIFLCECSSFTKEMNIKNLFVMTEVPIFSILLPSNRKKVLYCPRRNHRGAAQRLHKSNFCPSTSRDMTS